jgi:hypothetical protein
MQVPPPPDIVGTVIVPLVSALLGAIAGFWGARHQSKADLTRQRKAIASAILAELEYIDPTLRIVFNAPNAGALHMGFTLAAMDRFGEHVALFATDTIREVFACAQKLHELREGMEQSYATAIAGASVQPQEHWKIRLRAAFAIRAVNRARIALVREGGEAHSLPPPLAHVFPELPSIDDLLKLPPRTHAR